MYDPEAFKETGYRPPSLIKQLYLHNQMMDKIKKDYKTDEEDYEDEENDSDDTGGHQDAFAALDNIIKKDDRMRPS